MPGRPGVLVARSTAWLAARGGAAAGSVLVVITWLGARLAVAGHGRARGAGRGVRRLSAFLVVPVTAATETAGSLADRRAGARRVVRLLALRPLLDPRADPVALPPGPPDLHDPVTGLRAPAGALTVVDAGPGARSSPPGSPGSPTPLFAGARRRGAGRPGGPLRSGRRVVHAHPRICGSRGGWRDSSVVHGGLDVGTALDAAAATEIVDGFPDGLDEHLGERGRLGLGRTAAAARADPGSHRRRRPRPVRAHLGGGRPHRGVDRGPGRGVRRGRTTVVLTQGSPWRHVADDVVDLTRTLKSSTP